MSFISVLVPAVMLAVGVYLLINTAGISKDTVRRLTMRASGAVLAVAGCYFEIIASCASMTGVILRAIVMITAVGVVLSAEIVKGVEASCSKYSSGDVCSVAYNAKLTGTACFVMTLVLASVVPAI